MRAGDWKGIELHIWLALFFFPYFRFISLFFIGYFFFFVLSSLLCWV
jgi:hypothetical protein